jgi:hypothetical protein
VVEERADFFGGSVDLVGVLVEKGEKELFPPLPSTDHPPVLALSGLGQAAH